MKIADHLTGNLTGNFTGNFRSRQPRSAAERSEQPHPRGYIFNTGGPARPEAAVEGRSTAHRATHGLDVCEWGRVGDLVLVGRGRVFGVSDPLGVFGNVVRCSRHRAGSDGTLAVVLEVVH